MPTTESMIQSKGSPRTFALRDGRTVELRNGCLLDRKTRECVAGSKEAAAFLLAKGDLTKDERAWLEEWGFTLEATSRTGWTGNEVYRNKM